MTKPRVTVAVPVKDRRDEMLRCLDSILAQDYPSFEVLVLDNCSTDGTIEACRERAENAPVPVRVVVDPGNVAARRNMAVELGEGEVIAYTDSDCVPAPGWIAAGVAVLERDPGVGIVQGKTLPDPSKELRPWAATIEITEETGRFESCNMFVRSDALRESDGFDEEIGWFWEDTGAGWSIVRNGWRSAFAEDALVHHDVTYPGLKWWLRRAQRYGNGSAVIRRYPELRRELLWARYFARPREAVLLTALIGILLAPLGRGALALVLPYLWMRRPQAPTIGALRGSAEATLFELAILLGMVRGSLKYRTLVL